MPVEIEAKMRVPSLDSVRARLRASGAQFISNVLETNMFLDTVDHRLRNADSGLRIRQIESVDQSDHAAVITFKGPQQSGELKRREELELTVERLDAAEALLTRLGFVRDLMFQKRRESWELAGCRVELDELPMLGFFVEVEGPDDQAVLAAREQIGLADSPLIKIGYANMVAEELKKRGASSPRALTFS